MLDKYWGGGTTCWISIGGGDNMLDKYWGGGQHAG